jgi:polyisoprenoid-binding protein YceI
VTTATPGIHPRPGNQPLVSTGHWQVDPARSHASFTARVAGGPVRGHLPLTGGVLIATPIEDSRAWLSARTTALSTGTTVLDRMLTGPGFLDAGAFPEIRFHAELLTCVPAGWQAVGQLQVKGTDHPLACQLDVDPGQQADGPAGMTITSRWELDSRWVTRQRIPGLSRRIVMTCSVALEPDR